MDSLSVCFQPVCGSRGSRGGPGGKGRNLAKCIWSAALAQLILIKGDAVGSGGDAVSSKRRRPPLRLLADPQRSRGYSFDLGQLSFLLMSYPDF